MIVYVQLFNYTALYIFFPDFYFYCLAGTNVNFLAVNPGLVRGTKHVSSSPVFSESLLLRLAMNPLMWLFMKSPKQGCQSVIYAALDSEFEEIRGAYIR